MRRTRSADGATVDDLMMWLAYKEAKALIKFDAATAPAKKKSAME
jgi:hypothetical protein